MTPSVVHRPRAVNRRSVIAAGVALVTAASLAACGSGSEAPAASSGSAATGGEVTFLSWDNEATMTPVLQAFEKDNPGWTVKASYAPPVAEYIQKLQTQLGSGTAPDVFIITAENKFQLMQNGLVKDLSDQPFAGNLAAAEKQTYTKDGKLYGAAISSWGGGILVNDDLLAKAGATTWPNDWNGFIDLCKKLEAQGVTPYLEAVDGVTLTLAAQLGLQNAALGGQMDQQIWDGKTTFAQTWTPAVEAWNRLFTEGIVPTSAAGLKGDQVMQQFQQGKLAMMSTGSWGLAAVQKGAPSMKMSFRPVPGFTGQPYWAGAVSPGLAVNAKAKNPAGAAKFVQWMSTDAGVAAYQDVTKSITTTKDYTPKLDPALEQMVGPVRDGQFYLPVVSWPDHNDVLGTEATSLLQQVVSGQVKAADVGKGMDAKLAASR